VEEVIFSEERKKIKDNLSKKIFIASPVGRGNKRPHNDSMKEFFITKVREGKCDKLFTFKCCK
jgi:hypothetical protein